MDYVYDLVGKIGQVTDPTGTYGFAYDNMGRLIGTTTQYTFLPATTFSNTYTYDAASNRKTLTAPDGSTNTYNYDTLNRLSSLNSSLTGQFGFSYDGLSRRTQLARPNGINTNYSYDSLSRLLSVLHQAGSTTIDGASYSYDAAGNRTSKTNQLNNVTEGYAYDPLYQLTQVAQGATTTESYSYDVVGNRLSSMGVSSYNYNSSNQLSSTSSATYTYDNNGNTLTKADTTGTTSFNWDYDNRLSSVVLPTSGGTVSFKYDPFGRRIQKSSTTGTTDYIYDGISLIEEVDNSGSVLARYTSRQETDQPLAELRSGTTSYYETDGLGSITSVSNPTAVLTNTYTYDSFGKLTASTGTLGDPFQYTAREFDSETGLFYYRARYYDQNAGRFISEDPLGTHGGINSYRYAGNSPANYVDPYGLAKCYLWFENGRGSLYCVPDDQGVLPLAIPIASGNNVGRQCKNNQACEKTSGQGPIPHGWWQWTGPSQSHARSGGQHLEPMPGTDVLDLNGNPRDGILSHSCAYPFGPSTNPNNICSKGCITATPEDIRLLNDLIEAEPNSQVYVYGPGEGGPFH